MVDAVQPVGAMVQAPDPNKGISTISGLLGLRQQRQALQIGQQQLQQQQLQTAQQQGVQNFFKTWDPADHMAEDGSTDLDSALQSPEFKAAGNAKPAIMQGLLDIKQKQLGAKQSLSTLNKGLLDQFGTAVGSLANDEEVQNDKTDPKTGLNGGRAKVNQFMQNFSQLSPDAARVAGIYSPMIQHIPPGKLGHAVNALQLQAQSASEQQAQQNPVPGSFDTGSQILPTVTNRATGIPQLTGQAVNRQQMVTTPAGPLAVATPARGTLNPLATTGAQQPELNATTAQVATQNIAAQGLANRVTQAQSAANNTIQAQDALGRARALLDSSESPNTGAGFERVKGIKNLMASMGIDTQGADDANTLVKNLARYEAARATQAGLGGTDAARELAHNGSPNTQIDKAALKGIVTQSLATEKALAAYANIQSKTRDTGALAKNETDFRNIPNLIQGYEYGLARNPKEADEFLSRHGLSRADMAKTRSLIKEFESRGQ
jgi:hypothetical protein